jgi:hypothetical protein
MSETILVFVIILLIATSLGLLLARDWRWLVILLSVQYVGVFILVLQHLPLGMATVKVIAGWMGAAILGMTRSNLSITNGNGPSGRESLPQGRLFRLIAAVIVGLVSVAAAPLLDTMLADAGVMVSAGGLLLIGMGLLHLGVTDEILRVTIGLMTVLSGFEILYSAVETSVLVAALLVIINLGLALVGSYLMIAANAQESETA